MSGRSAEPSPAARDQAAILADLDALHARQRALYEELARAGSLGSIAPPRAIVATRPPVTLGEAAEAVKWTESRVRRHIVKHNSRYPKDRLGWQPGGEERGRWYIPLDRWLRYVNNQPGPL